MRLPANLKKPSGFVPLAMSLAALAVVLVHIVVVGTAREPDEGAAAHIWQLLMAGQVPIVLFMLIRWLPQRPGPTLLTLALQLVAIIAAMAPVYFLGL